MADSPPPHHLTPSELGTKQHWDGAYLREISNHQDSPDDEGTVWFSDSSAEEKMIELLESYAHRGLLFMQMRQVGHDGPEPSSILDLGTGNGHLLFELRKEGWQGLMLGVDYSDKSVELAKRIEVTRRTAANEDPSAGEWRTVDFEVYNILNPSPLPTAPPQGFDAVLDKGTFDAISLSPDIDTEGRRVFESYATRVLPLVAQNGLLVVTSCNWTEDELKHWFEKDGLRTGSFVQIDRVEYPSFTFGGQQGSSIATLVFQKLGRK